MIDAHAHLYLPELADDLDSVIERFRSAGGTHIINSATDPSSICEVISQAHTHPEILPTAGLHPELLVPGCDLYCRGIDEVWIETHLGQLRRTLSKYPQIVGVGECGLDYYWVKHERISERERLFELQRKLFAGCIELAAEFDLPLVIHCRDEHGDKQAEADALKLLVESNGGCVKGFFHSYTGSRSYLDDILGLGFFVSFNGIVTYKNADNVRDLLDAVPLERLLLETDAPFLVPNSLRAQGVKVCESVFITETAEFVAKRKGVPVTRLWKQMHENACEVFGVGG
ncbi:MAG: TatD family hydrolase [Candidatus Dojkabacteria bacterium]|nr:TatD family hydrolase [Candidatus Dojkabacteria bacterium]